MLRHRLVRLALVRLLGGFVVGAPVGAGAAETPLLARPETPAPGSTPADRSLLGALRTAVQAGLPSLAESFGKDALAKYAGNPALLRSARLAIADARLQKSDFEGVNAILADIPGDDAAKNLRLGLAAYGLGRLPEARSRLAGANAAALAGDDPARRDALAGMLAADEGRADASERFFGDALARVGNAPTLQFEIRLLRARARLRTRRDPNLAGIIDPLSDARQTYQLAKLRAIELGLQGKTAEAVRALNAAAVGDPDLDADRKLTIGLLHDKNRSDGGGGRNPDGRAALLAAVNAEGFPEIQTIALAGLRQAVLGADPRETGVNATPIYAALSGIAAARPNSEVADMIHYVRADIMYESARRATDAGEREVALRNALQASRDLERFPNSPLASDALALAASIAWNLRDYLRAADAYYSLATARTTPAANKAALYIAAADCYFLNKDYARAADAYRAARRAGLPADAAGDAFADEIRSTLADENSPDRVANAAKIFAEAGNAVPARSRLQAAWIVADREFKSGEYARALTLVNSALRESSDPGMKIRFLWLRSRIELNTGRYAAAAATAAEIAAGVESPAAGTVAEIAAARDTILAQTKRLRAQAVLGDRNIDSARKEFAELREKYRDQPSAADSYLDEGRFLSDRGDHAEALKVFMEGYERFNGNAKLSENAANLIFEAAGEALTLADADGNLLQKAFDLFDRLRREHPESVHYFTASLRCGDILRLQNHFDAALKVYQDLVDKRPDDPGRMIAELDIADCYLEKGGRGAAEESRDNYERAAKDYARLVDLPRRPADLAAEAAYKRALATSKAPTRGVPGATGEKLARDEAAKTLFATVNFLLGTPSEAKNLGINGRYWAARSFFLVAQLRAENGDFAEARNALSRLREYNARLPFGNLVDELFTQYTRPRQTGS